MASCSTKSITHSGSVTVILIYFNRVSLPLRMRSYPSMSDGSAALIVKVKSAISIFLCSPSTVVKYSVLEILKKLASKGLGKSY